MRGIARLINKCGVFQMGVSCGAHGHYAVQNAASQQFHNGAREHYAAQNAASQQFHNGARGHYAAQNAAFRQFAYFCAQCYFKILVQCAQASRPFVIFSVGEVRNRLTGIPLEHEIVPPVATVFMVVRVKSRLL